MISISHYRQVHLNGKIYIHSEEMSVCPVCSSMLQVIGSKHRKVIDQSGNKQTYVIRRLRCKKCKTIHHELPDLMVPYKRHCLQTIEQVVSSDSGMPTSSDISNTSYHTVRRIRQWWSTVFAYFMGIMASLQFKFGCAPTATSRPRNIIRAVVNTHNWVHTRSVMMSMLC